MDPSVIGAATLAISQAVSSFNTFLPSIAEIRKKGPDTDAEFTADVRMGELAAVSVALGVGVIVSGLTKSSTPAVVAFIVSLGLIVLYESALRADRPMEATA